MASVTAKENFSTDIRGVPTTVSVGTLWDEDAEIVRRYPDKFEQPQAPKRIESVSSEPPPKPAKPAKPRAKAQAKPKRKDDDDA